MSDAEIRDKYYELLYAVATKWPGENRHETALRYIIEREERYAEPARVAFRASEPPKPIPVKLDPNQPQA